MLEEENAKLLGLSDAIFCYIFNAKGILLFSPASSVCLKKDCSALNAKLAAAQPREPVSRGFEAELDETKTR